MQMPFENIATTSDQQSSQTTNKTIVSINRVKVLSINNTLQCQSQQLSMLYSCKENLEPNLNVFSRFETVKKTLENHVQGTSILNAELKNSFNESHRKTLVRIVLSHIVVTELISAQNDNFYPPDESKISLANAIVSEFPSLKNNVKGYKRYEHYFDPKTRQGFIEYRLWTIRAKLSSKDKKYSALAMKRKAQYLKESPTASDIVDET
ncbi:hypothetical protein ALC60_01417 [Trachymyrmex zeteki]|uniref:Uncharacterized protein n=1 Tax=Mycetomoellerius zeteki TaxID=64791 RepID=A0A151XGM9_9HYME|nr:PREDICTED: uncharacterized protein LOC108729623 [Trachymyrmex zeteki]KYQ59562.1 hypothetical protein ALC60_01417 [Trachymyrmex zeteki]